MKPNLKPGFNPIETIESLMLRMVFAARWLLAPLYLGLIPAIALYVFKFFRHLAELVWQSSTLSDTELLLGILKLLDIVMVANLIVMTMIGGFTLFIRRASEESKAGSELPWLNHIDTTALKVKLGMALIGVSSVHLLEAFVNADHTGYGQLTKLVVVHLVFVVSTVAIALIGKHQSK